MNRCLMTDDARRALFVRLNKQGYRDRWMRLAYASSVVGRIVDTFTALTDEEADRVIAALDAQEQ